MKTSFVIFCVLVSLLIGWSANAVGQVHKYDAVVRCRFDLTEDSAANIELVRYTHEGETLVYRCVKFN